MYQLFILITLLLLYYQCSAFVPQLLSLSTPATRNYKNVLPSLFVPETPSSRLHQRSHILHATAPPDNNNNNNNNDDDDQSRMSVHELQSLLQPSVRRQVADKAEQLLSEDQNLSNMGLNELQTLLREATRYHEFEKAEKLLKILFDRLETPPFARNVTLTSEEQHLLRQSRMTWSGLGTAPWLIDRLQYLNYTIPTTIQMHSMEAINQLLNDTSDLLLTASMGDRVNTLVDTAHNMGVVVSGSTGSGKTLAYLVPLLSSLSASLFSRQKIRVGAEESVGDRTGDLIERLSIVKSPILRALNRHHDIETPGAALATLGKSGYDIKKPLALIVLPTRELGMQTGDLLYELVGGSVEEGKGLRRTNPHYFNYEGPQGVRIGCVLTDAEAKLGIKLQTDVVLTKPKYLKKLIMEGDVVPSKLRFVVYDEADLALEQTDASDLASLFGNQEREREYSRLTYLVGASVTESLGNLAVRSQMLPEGRSYIATATRSAPLLANMVENDSDGKEMSNSIVGEHPEVATLKDLSVCLDPGLRHQRMQVDNGMGLLGVIRLLRKELKAFDERRAVDKNAERPRVVIYFPDEATAKQATDSVRRALWGDHNICVLLPTMGHSPMEMMDLFKKNEASVMLATPNSVRGLDFPSVSHVYTLYLPMDDPREYIHLAGRVGRVGQKGNAVGGGGQVVSVLTPEEAGKMDEMAKKLGIKVIDLEYESEKFVEEVEFDSLAEAINKVTDFASVTRHLEDMQKLVTMNPATAKEVTETGWGESDNRESEASTTKGEGGEKGIRKFKRSEKMIDVMDDQSEHGRVLSEYIRTWN